MNQGHQCTASTNASLYSSQQDHALSILLRSQFGWFHEQKTNASRLSDEVELDPRNGQQHLQQEGSTRSHHESLQRRNWCRYVV